MLLTKDLQKQPTTREMFLKVDVKTKLNKVKTKFQPLSIFAKKAPS